jgi:uncharacterized membrane-anchored protein
MSGFFGGVALTSGFYTIVIYYYIRQPLANNMGAKEVEFRIISAALVSMTFVIVSGLNYHLYRK